MVGIGAPAGVIGQPAPAEPSPMVLPAGGAESGQVDAAKPRKPRARKSEV
jgi:hypothetical protein